MVVALGTDRTRQPVITPLPKTAQTAAPAAEMAALLDTVTVALSAVVDAESTVGEPTLMNHSASSSGQSFRRAISSPASLTKDRICLIWLSDAVMEVVRASFSLSSVRLIRLSADRSPIA